MMNGTAKWLVGAFAAMVAAVLAGCVVALGTGAAGAADIGGVEDPHIAAQLERERAAGWALNGWLLGGIALSESDFNFDTGSGPVSVDGVSGDSYFGAARVTLERRFGAFSFGPLAEAGLFADSNNAFTIAGSEITDFEADWYWKAGAIAAFELLPGAEVFGTLAYGEIETGDVSFGTDKTGDPDLSGLVYSGGVRLEVSPRVGVVGEVVKWHDVSGDATGVDLDSNVIQVLGGVSVTFN